MSEQQHDSGLATGDEKRQSDGHLANDMLEGAEQIGAFIGLKPRQVYHLQDKLPVFQIGAKLFARKSTIVRWIAEQERGAGQ